MEELNKLCGEITLKLDNTAEYESWLIVQDYIDSFKQALNEIKDHCNDNIQIYKNEQYTDEWGFCIEELQEILEIIDKVLGEDS